MPPGATRETAAARREGLSHHPNAHGTVPDVIPRILGRESSARADVWPQPVRLDATGQLPDR